MEKWKLNIKDRRALRLEAYKMAYGTLPNDPKPMLRLANSIYEELLPFVAQERYQEAEPGDIYNGGSRG